MAAGLGIGWGINWGSIALSAKAVLDYLTFKLNFNTIATDFTFTRNSFATRVNENGLIETVTNLGSDLVQNGSFDELGSELVTNGEFDTDTDWTKAANWSIADGKASSNGSGGNLQQSNVVTANEVNTYLVSYDIVDYVSGGVIPNLHGSISGTQGTAVGSYSVYITGISSANTSLFFISNNFNGSIDNVSVKQVDPNDDWNNEGVWTIGNGYASGNGATGSSEELGQNISASGILVGDTVKCSFELKNYVSGSVQIIGISNTVSRSANGIYEFQGDITSTNIRFRGSAFFGDVTNLIIQEVIEDDVPRIDYTGSTFDIPVLGDELVTNGSFDTDSNWSKQSGWSIANGVATFDINNYSGGNANIFQNCMVSGKEYVLTYDVVDYVQGFVRNVSRSGAIPRTANGTYTEKFTASNANLYLKADSGTNTILSIDNVSVKEVTAYTTTDKGAFLLEPISTNLAIYSEDASQGILSNCTVQSGFVSPSGSSNAYKLIEDNTNSIKLFRAVNNSLSTPDTSYSSSIFVKSDERTKVRVYGYHLANQYFFVDYDLTDNSYLGSFGQNTQVDGYSIEDIGDNGWKRITIIGQKTASYSWDVGVSPLNDNGDGTYLGDGTSGLYIWGAQLEELSYSTSYIPTSSTTVTRAQESCVNATPTINSEEGVLYAEISSLTETDSSDKVISINKNGLDEWIVSIKLTSVGEISCLIKENNIKKLEVVTTGVDVVLNNKIAILYKSGESKAYLNGIQIGSTSTSTFTDLELDSLTFDRGDGNREFYGRTKDLRIYDKALTDDELTELTAPPPPGPLLDDYPNASAAYSLRELSEAMEGNAVVRVRRSNDNTEQDFTSSEITDGTLTTFTGANDGFVTTWYDQSGNSSNATQATANEQPKLVSSGVVELDNGKPCIIWDNINDRMQINTSYSGNNLLSIFSVHNKTSPNPSDDSAYLVFADASLNVPDGVLAWRWGGQLGCYRSGVHSVNGSIPYDTQVNSNFLYTSTQVDFYNNSSLIGSKTTSNAIANFDYTFIQIGRTGGNTSFKNQELIIYQSDQSSNRTGIETNINTEYTIY